MSLKRNIVANFAGSIWLALMGLAFVPFYIRILGVESYGVVGIFVTLQSIFLILDMGLTQSIARELARLSAIDGGFVRMATTLRTMELVYWGVAALVAVTVALLAYPIAHYWVNTSGLQESQVFQSILLIALIMGLRWPVSLYIGGLNGLQRQVEVNKTLAFFATLQGLGALLALWFVAPTLMVFFLWQGFVAAAQLLHFRRSIAKAVNLDHYTIFDMNVLRGVWRFAAGMTGISLLTTVLTQLDKILLSKILSLKEFGLYMFATTVASVIVRIVAPLFTSYSPRLSALVAYDKNGEQSHIYHQGCQLMTVLIVPVAVTLAFFGGEIILFWSRDADIAISTGMMLALLVLGNMFNGLATIPYALQLANGWTQLALYQNVVGVFFLAPAIYISTTHYGGVGAAFCWMVLNFCYFFIGVPFMYRRIMKGHFWIWLSFDVLGPALPALILLSILKLVFINYFVWEWHIFLIIIFWFISALLGFFCSRNLKLVIPFFNFSR